MFTFAGEVWADYSNGMAAYARGDYKTAYREFMDAADHGESDALMNLAFMAGQPRCGPKMPGEEEELLCKAAEAKNYTAKFMVHYARLWGRSFCESEGGNQPEGIGNFIDLAEAAAEQGFPMAMVASAQAYENVTKPADPVRAYAWYTVAARRGLKNPNQDDSARVAATLTPEETIRGQQLAEQLDAKTPKSRLIEIDPAQTCQPKTR